MITIQGIEKVYRRSQGFEKMKKVLLYALPLMVAGSLLPKPGIYLLRSENTFLCYNDSLCTLEECDASNHPSEFKLDDTGTITYAANLESKFKARIISAVKDGFFLVGEKEILSAGEKQDEDAKNSLEFKFINVTRAHSCEFSYTTIVDNSDLFFSNFSSNYNSSCKTNLIKNLVKKKRLSPANVVKQATNTSILIDHEVYGLIKSYLTHKKLNGNATVKNLYENIDDVESLIDRLMIKKPFAPYENNDQTDQFKTKGSRPFNFPQPSKGDWVKIGTEREGSLKMKDYLSHEEMQLLALISISSPTTFINNCALKQNGAPKNFEENGIIVSVVGPQLKFSGYMESNHLVKNGRNGKFFLDAAFEEMLNKFYGIDPNSVNETDFIETSTKLHRNAYKKRLEIALRPVLIHASYLGTASGKKVHLRLSALCDFALSGLKHAEIYLDVVKQIVEGNDLNGIDIIEALNIGKDQEKTVIKDAFRRNITLMSTRNSPADKVSGKRILVSMISTINKSAANGCSTIQELQNPHINQCLTAKNSLAVFSASNVDQKSVEAAVKHEEILKSRAAEEIAKVDLAVKIAAVDAANAALAEKMDAELAAKAEVEELVKEKKNKKADIKKLALEEQLNTKVTKECFTKESTQVALKARLVAEEAAQIAIIEKSAALEAASVAMAGKLEAEESVKKANADKMAALMAAEKAHAARLTAEERASKAEDEKMSALEVAEKATAEKLSSLEAAEKAISEKLSALEALEKATTEKSLAEEALERANSGKFEAEETVKNFIIASAKMALANRQTAEENHKTKISGNVVVTATETVDERGEVTAENIEPMVMEKDTIVETGNFKINENINSSMAEEKDKPEEAKEKMEDATDKNIKVIELKLQKKNEELDKKRADLKILDEALNKMEEDIKAAELKLQEGQTRLDERMADIEALDETTRKVEQDKKETELKLQEAKKVLEEKLSDLELVERAVITAEADRKTIELKLQEKAETEAEAEKNAIEAEALKEAATRAEAEKRAAELKAQQDAAAKDHAEQLEITVDINPGLKAKSSRGISGTPRYESAKSDKVKEPQECDEAAKTLNGNNGGKLSLAAYLAVALVLFFSIII